MTILLTIFTLLISVAWMCVSIAILISVIQSIVFERKSEKREREYHEKLMKDFR